VIQTENATVYIGNNLDILPTLPDNSVDSIVTDPPYELGFMGKSWDSSGIAYNVDLWRECLRVLKPGGHLLSFGGTRTWHRIAVAIEDAGFEVRDSIAWLYGSGFPKSLDVSKAIDKAAGAEREVTGSRVANDIRGNKYNDSSATMIYSITAPSTPEAQQWEGWGTALKPAFEPVIVARKPLIGTVAANVLEHGTGALNIDGSRIGTTDNLNGGAYAAEGKERNDGWGMQRGQAGDYQQPTGRWPANVILDEYSAGLLDEQSGQTKSASTIRPANSTGRSGGIMGKIVGRADIGQPMGHNDTGGASRFFYVAKASKRDRNEGLEDLEDSGLHKWNGSEGHRGVGDYYPDGTPRPVNPMKNFHPTVKPTTLMRYLVKLVTPPGGTVLDPFTGSGSTGKAAILEGFTFIGCEMTEDYLPIIQGRLEHAEATAAAEKDKRDEALF
jgi:site-specific DNA-methyltransferase (adenine-specific)